MTLAELRTDSFAYTIDTTGRTNNQVSYVATISGGGIAYSDTFTKYYGGLAIVYNEPCNNLSHWTASGWGLSNAHQSAPTGFTDSPNGNYPDQGNLELTMDTIIDLSQASSAYLTFSAKWDIETSFDYSQVFASLDGNTWTPLCGQYTHNGGVYQATYQPLYDGHQLSWVKEFIDLSDYTGQQVKLKFKTVSDQAVNFDGFVFDDLKIWANAVCTPLPSVILSLTDSVFNFVIDTITLHAATSAGATYQWQRNGTIINGATDSIFNATTWGTYTVTTYNGRSCPTLSKSVTLRNGVGIATMSQSFDIAISPNPFTTSLQVKFSLDKSASINLSIKDITGRIIATKTVIANAGSNTFEWQMDTSLSSGVYLLTGQSEVGNFVARVVKQ